MCICNAGPSSRSTVEPKQAGGQPGVMGEPEPEEHATTAMHEDSQEDEDEQEDAEEKQAKGLADLLGKGALHRPCQLRNCKPTAPLSLLGHTKSA